MEKGSFRGLQCTSLLAFCHHCVQLVAVLACSAGSRLYWSLELKMSGFFTTSDPQFHFHFSSIFVCGGEW